MHGYCMVIPFAVSSCLLLRGYCVVIPFAVPSPCLPFFWVVICMVIYLSLCVLVCNVPWHASIPVSSLVWFLRVPFA